MKTIKELYSSVEEYNPLVVDKFERFRSYLSGNPNKMEPILSRYLYNNGFRPIYKDNKKYAICLSHDVDLLYERKSKKTYITDSVRSLKNANVGKSIYYLKNVINHQLNPDWLLDKFIDLEENNNIPATYYFLALGQGEDDFNYTVDSVRPYLERIRSNGGEIGLHGGHQAFNSEEKIASERKKLEHTYGHVVKGYRNHYLRFKTPNTWEHLQNLGFVYDTTFGYADLPGYRSGLCYPYRPFNVRTNSFIDIIELPLIVMDVSFWKYMGLDIEKSFILFKKIASDIKKINGVLTILWHNNSLLGEEGLLYNKIIDYIVKDEDAWFANSMDLALFWKEKNLPLMEEMITAGFSHFLAEG